MLEFISTIEITKLKSRRGKRRDKEYGRFSFGCLFSGK